MTDFAKQHSGIFKIQIFNKPIIVVNDPDAIHEVLVKKTSDFAGRPYSYRAKLITRDFSEIALTDAGPEHSERRKVLPDLPKTSWFQYSCT